MRLMFSQIETVLADAHSVGEAAKVPFRARIRNLRRTGINLPSGAAGRKANYEPADLFKLSFAVELLQVGIGPEPAATTVAAYWPDFVKALLAARSDRLRGVATGQYLVAEPKAMTSKIDRFNLMTGDQLVARLSGLEALLVTRLLIINVAGLLLKIDEAVRRAGIDIEAFMANLDQELIRLGGQ